MSTGYLCSPPPPPCSAIVVSMTNRDGSRTLWYDFDQTVNWAGMRCLTVEADFLARAPDLRAVLEVMGYEEAAGGTVPNGWRVVMFHKAAKLPPRRT